MHMLRAVVLWVLMAGTAAAQAAAPRLILETSMGEIKVELYSEQAPKTVANFLSYARSGFYDGTVFHRVIPGFVVQGGGYDAKLAERPPAAAIENESMNGLHNVRGSLAMARTADPHSANSQFFINVQDNLRLDANTEVGRWGYTVFGKVVSGMEIVDKISEVPTRSVPGLGPNVPVDPVLVHRLRLETTEQP